MSVGAGLEHPVGEVPARRGRVVVTGGTGFIGSHVVAVLRRRGVPCVVLRRDGRGPDVVRTDFDSADGLAQALRPGDIVIHLACGSNPAVSEHDPLGDAETNLLGSLRLFAACGRSGVARVVFASSGGTVYGHPEVLPIPETHPTRPTSLHGTMKLSVERYLESFARRYGYSHATLRCANVYGPGQTGARGLGIVGRAIQTVLLGEALELWGDGSVVRDFVYVGDVAEAFVRAAFGEVCDITLNIGCGRPTSMREAIRLVGLAAGKPVRVRYHAARPVDVSTNVLDCTRARHLLGWQATTSLEEGIARTFAWAARLHRLGAA